MTLTLELPAADEAAWRDLAQALAQAPADVRAAALQEAVGVLRRGEQSNGPNAEAEYSPRNATDEVAAAAMLRELDEMARIHGSTAPPLADDAVRRARADYAAERLREAS